MRNALAQAMEMAGFVAVAVGVLLVAGLGPALVVGGVLVALLAVQVERGGA